MIESYLNNKIPKEFISLEDLLTSEIFGFIQFLPNEILIKILEKSENIFNKFAIGTIPEPKIKSINYNFWPRYKNYGEPDLLLKLDNFYLIIEIKYNSKPGQYQLENYYKLLKDEYNMENPLIILLSPMHHYHSILNTCSEEIQKTIFSLTWKQLKEILDFTAFEEPYNSMAKKCVELLNFHNFKNFDGFNKSINVSMKSSFYKTAADIDRLFETNHVVKKMESYYER
ncbi:PD-(D/E)XK nuclease family protein [Alkalispirochaeta alkalica]|uniref:PD-(D/E)XK nuclease family protein n=1 Tax=Alkalispirochaeta alkalica TaxID=46356 RepID=UPI0003A27E1F|nr:PD-(D/E)XK nuclease family protein [Alkalispirochaeta alkalica]